MKKKNILLCAAGTAGHINPSIAVAEQLKKDKNINIYFLISGSSLEKSLLKDYADNLIIIPKVVFPRKFSKDLILFPFRLNRLTQHMKRVLLEKHIDICVGFGAYISYPALIASKRLKIPYIIHESNIKAGIANRFTSRKAMHAFKGFENTNLKNAIYFPTPLRKDFFKKLNKTQLEKQYSLNPEKPLLLIVGGSLGASSINNLFYKYKDEILKLNWQIIHICGQAWADNNKAKFKKYDFLTSGLTSGGKSSSCIDYKLFKYIDNIADLMKYASFIVSRSGSGTVNEITQLKKPALYIPYPHGNGEQKLNILSALEKKYAIFAEDKNLNKQWFFDEFLEFIKNKNNISALQNNFPKKQDINSSAIFKDYILKAINK